MTDDPVNYKDQPGLEFLRAVPTVWDETHVLDGVVGQHIIMARRNGRQWFVGGMTGEKAFEDHLSLGFLPQGQFVAHIYADPADNNASYEALKEMTKQVSSVDSLDLHMRPAGGVAISFTPVGGMTATLVQPPRIGSR